MYLLEQWLPAIVMAVAVSAAVSMLAIPWAKCRAQQALAGLALAGGYASGHLFTTGWVSLPPADTTNWPPSFALAAAIIGSASLLVRRKSARLIAAALLSILAMRLLLEPKFLYGWTSREGWVWAAVFGANVALLSLPIDASARHARIRFETPVLLLIVCAGTAGALVLSGSLLLGQFAAVLAASLIGLVAHWRRSYVSGEAFSLVFSLLHSALLVSGYFFSELPATSAIVLGTAPGLVVVPVPSSSPWMAFAGRSIMAMIAAALACYVAFRASPPLIY